mgnify:FL=1
MVRDIAKINSHKTLYYTVTHYLDYDAEDRYELSVVHFFLDPYHKHYVGHSSTIETRRL